MIDAYPLAWPQGWKRTPKEQRERGSFAGSMDKIRRELVAEVDRLVLGQRARTHTINDLIISTNVRLRQDGYPYASAAEPEDPGVAIYFERAGKQLSIACDKYDRVWKNMRAIQKVLEAMRGIERWGASEMMDRAFTGFLMLPEHSATPWRDVLSFDLNEMVTLRMVLDRYRELAKTHHPDVGGDPGIFDTITKARDMALQEVK